nr:uncharacterized protein LOC118681238 [Bactrocera oleae]
MQPIRACNPSLPTEGWKFVKAFDDSVAESGVETKRATMQILLLLTKESIEPLAKSGKEINYGFTKVRITPYKSDADAADHLASESETCEVEKDPMEFSSDVESIEQDAYEQLNNFKAGSVKDVQIRPKGYTPRDNE